MFDDIEKLIHFAPDEGSGGGDGSTIDLDAEVDLGDGETTTYRQLIADGQQKAEWQRELKQKEMDVAERRKATDALALEAVKNNTPPPAPKDDETPAPFNLEEAYNNLPDPVEDPEGFKRGHMEIARRQGEEIERNAVAQAEQKATQSQGEQGRRESRKEADRASKDNERRCREWAEAHEMGLTPNQVDELIEAVDSLRGEQFGRYEDHGNGLRTLVYDENAYQAAMNLVPSIRTQLDAELTNQARNEALETIPGGQVPVPASKPPANASTAEKLEWLQSLPESQQAAAVENMSDDEKEALTASAYGKGTAAW